MKPLMPMRRLLLLLLASAPLLAWGQGLSPGYPGVGGGKVLASFPLSTTGPLIAEDALTVAHVYWNDTTIVDTKGNVWAQNGTVPHVASTPSPFIPGKNGAGPFSIANFYSHATAGDIVGQYTICAVFATTDIVTVTGIFDSLSVSTGGAAGSYASGKITIYAGRAAGPGYDTVSSPAGSLVAGGPNVACWGIAGTTMYVKANLTTTANTAGAVSITGGGTGTRIGLRLDNTWAHTGTIYEVYATATPWNEANVTEIQQKVLGHFDGTSPLTVTRATNATYIPRAADGQLYTAAAGVARITEDGLLVEPARTNYALYSNTMTGNWAIASATEAAGTASPLGGTWNTVTSTGSTGFSFRALAGAFSATTTLVTSAWAKKESGSGYASVWVACASDASVAKTGCTCLRSDGGACSAITPSGNYCAAEASDLGTTPVRLSATITCASDVTGAQIVLSPGRYGTSTGTTSFVGGQLEVGTYPTSLIVTAGTAVARNADAISATVPAVPSKWCVAVTAKPEEGRTSNDEPFWNLGSGGGANTARATPLAFTVVDAAVAAKSALGTDFSGSKRFVDCDATGSLSRTRDGVTTSSLVGVGTGILSASPTTLNLFYPGYYFGGYLKNVKICAAKSAKECK